MAGAEGTVKRGDWAGLEQWAEITGPGNRGTHVWKCTACNKTITGTPAKVSLHFRPNVPGVATCPADKRNHEAFAWAKAREAELDSRSGPSSSSGSNLRVYTQATIPRLHARELQAQLSQKIMLLLAKRALPTALVEESAFRDIIQTP